jgi:hypothetical protein
MWLARTDLEGDNLISIFHTSSKTDYTPVNDASRMKIFQSFEYIMKDKSNSWLREAFTEMSC